MRIFKSIFFKLLLIVCLFSVFVNIVHAHDLDQTQSNKEDDKIKLIAAPQDIQQIFTTLQFMAGSKASSVKLWAAETNVLNAYMDSDGNLVLFRGLLNFAIRDRNNYEMVAGVIGHELGHHMLGHVSWFSTCNLSAAHSRDCEREADAYGIKLMWDAGYGCEGDADFYKELMKQWPTDMYASQESGHPGNLERYLWSTKACNALKSGQPMPAVNYETRNDK
jgi:predicted Zn-dependent protease